MNIRPTAFALVLVLATCASAQTWPADFEAVALPGTFDLPVGLTFAPDGTLFVLEKPGVVRIHRGSSVQPTPFLDLGAEVNLNNDRGLLGVALHPGFVPDGGSTSWVYLLYTVSPVYGEDLTFNQNNQFSFSRLTRYRAVQSGSLLTAVLASRQILLGHQQPDGSVPDAIASVHDSHSNGSLHFADDGTLILATGDGAHYDLTDTAVAGDNPAFDNWTHPTTGLKGPTPAVQDAGAFRSQDLRSLSGKILRLDPETGLGLPSNPFFDGDLASHRSRVWALGLRNPYRMTLVPGTGAADPALGQINVLTCGDVGWNKYEELNLSRFGGENFGWPCWEGNLTQTNYQGFDPASPLFPNCHTARDGALTLPEVTWHHGNLTKYWPPGSYQDEDGNSLGAFTGNCAIGGTFYTGGSYPDVYDGRLFFADYGQGWIKSAEFDGNWDLAAVHPFATGVGAIVGIERHPLTGDLHYLHVGNGRIYQLRYATNFTPVAHASATPVTGPAPLLVSFGGASSSDPDGDPLSFDWDFGDGSPHGGSASPQHAYAADGVYDVVLTVADPLGLSSVDGLTVWVGNAPPSVSLLSPLPGHTFETPVDLPLDAAGSDPEGLPLSWSWSIDLHHDTHVHPGNFASSQQQDVFPIAAHGDEGGLVYYRVTVTATDAGGLAASAHAYVFEEHQVVDVTGTALPISRMDELSPPQPLGGGNHDIEVLRDGVQPAVGTPWSMLQYDTYHAGAQGQDDWIGFELAQAPAPEQRFTALVFQEGQHFFDGGWWDSLDVEARKDGTWTGVEGLAITPAYPFASDGASFETYRFDFDPAEGDALRLRGDPGGSAGFVSCGELRALLVRASPPAAPFEDITEDGAVIAKVFTLSPPGSQGPGNPAPGTIRNGTLPPVGSSSLWAEFDTFHSGDQAGDDWIGYDFGATRSLSRLLFQEGPHFVEGGAWDTLGVEVQTSAGGPWTAATGLTVDPPYPGWNGVGAGYESFTLDFAPVAARAVRLRGDPYGLDDYVSVGELRVFGPALSEGCGFSSYGEGLGGKNTLALQSLLPVALGLPALLKASGASGAGSGYLGVAAGTAALPFLGGTLLLDPAPLLLVPWSFDASGTASLGFTLPDDPALVGLELAFQAFSLGASSPQTLRMSHGLLLSICDA